MVKEVHSGIFFVYVKMSVWMSVYIEKMSSKCVIAGDVLVINTVIKSQEEMDLIDEE